MPISAESRLELGTVLTGPDGTRYLVYDALGGKVRLVHIPAGMTEKDFGVKFKASPEPGDPTRSTLYGSDE